MKHIGLLTKELADEFLEDRLSKYKCSCCQNIDKPALLVTPDNDISFSILNLYQISIDNSSSNKIMETPTLPLMCQNCGHIHHLAALVILDYFSNKGMA
ncbi:putative uncharacterized phage protein [Aliivibrio wodanis]|uniref:Uncharacterized phage protein n=1 Tax=Aliivibrio wodanis TaxID=80852 RepID=A0A090ICA2_9GAMM|nr:putative uncharacterized phage protein [Aliivibrio wodanis]